MVVSEREKTSHLSCFAHGDILIDASYHPWVSS
jgi:hypothetical protein